jgi:YD repeat-containing protein
MPAAAKITILASRSTEEIFFVAAGVAVAVLETHRGPHEAQGKKPHQGIFSKNRRLRLGPTWVKWSGTHQDRKCSRSKTVSGSALDANGNTLTDASGKNYTWDFENRLVSAVVPGTGTVAFKYDPFGRRIQKSSPLGTTNYLYDGLGGEDILDELNTSGSIVTGYTTGILVDEPLAVWRSSTELYYDADGLGSISSLSKLLHEFD